MMLCLNDEEIMEDGGLNPLMDVKWLDADLRTSARNFCKAIVLVTCGPRENIPKLVCKMYIDAAIVAGYHMIFVGKDITPHRYQRLKIENAKSKFEADPERFWQETGKYWFFCYCAPDTREDCIGIGVHISES